MTVSVLFRCAKPNPDIPQCDPSRYVDMPDEHPEWHVDGNFTAEEVVFGHYENNSFVFKLDGSPVTQESLDAWNAVNDALDDCDDPWLVLCLLDQRVVGAIPHNAEEFLNDIKIVAEQIEDGVWTVYDDYEQIGKECWENYVLPELEEKDLSDAVIDWISESIDFEELGDRYLNTSYEQGNFFKIRGGKIAVFNG